MPLSPIASLATVLLGAGSAAAQVAAPAGRVWTHASRSEGWTPRVVAIGNNGTEVLTQLGPFTDFTRLFSSFDQDPPSPLWQVTASEPTFHHAVAAADTVDVQVTLHDTYSDATLQSRRLHLARISASDPANNWTYSWPITTPDTDRTGVRIARDASRIVALALNPTTSQTDVKVFSQLSNVPLLQFSATTFGPFRGFDLSADGTRLYMVSGLNQQVLDLTNGLVLFSEFVFEPTYSAFGISGDGSWFAYGTNGKAKLYHRNALTGLYAFEFSVDLAGPCVCDRLDLSDDGSTLACLFNFTDQFRNVQVECVDLATHQLTMSELVHGQGSLQNVAADISISADGRRFVAGLWGDELGFAQEVRLYARDQNAPLYTFDLPGSVFDVDLSADGRRFAVASKATHANQLGGGGRIDLFRALDEDIAIEGRPQAGTSVMLKFAGTPGKPAVMLLAPGPAHPPIFFPTLGTLYIDRSQLTLLPMGSFDASGIASRSFTLPALPGSTLWFQGFASQPRRLSQDWLRATVVP